MRRPFDALLSAGLVLGVVACGGSPTASPTPVGATQAPGGATAAVPSIAIPSIAVPTLSAGGGTTTGTQCAAYPTFSIGNSVPPSFAPDPVLESHFPGQVDGQPVTDITTRSWLAYICLYAGGRIVSRETGLFLGGFNEANLTFGSAQATVDGDEVTIDGFRYAGGDGTAVIQYLNQIAFALSGGSDTPQPFTMSTANIGGKNAEVATNADGKVTDIYPNGDTIIGLDNVTQDQASKIFAALP